MSLQERSAGGSRIQHEKADVLKLHANSMWSLNIWGNSGTTGHICLKPYTQPALYWPSALYIWIYSGVTGCIQFYSKTQIFACNLSF